VEFDGECVEISFYPRAMACFVATSSTPETGKDPFWAPASVVGLTGFGMTTMLAGVATATGPLGVGANWGVDNGVVFPMAMAFGGSAQFISGLVMMRRGEIFPGSAFLGFGAFWWAFTLFLGGLLPTSALGPTAPYDIMWFAIVWAMFTFSFAINSHHHGKGIAFVFWTLVLAFILLAVDYGRLAALTLGGDTTVQAAKALKDLWMVSGIEIFVCGAAAWYVATGILTAAHHGGKKVLPY
jgi:uncharacterized protein